MEVCSSTESGSENISSQNVTQTLYPVKDVATLTAGFQVLFGSLGFVGNLVCLIVLRFKAMSGKDHTNLLIINQCVADLLTSVLLVIATIDFTWFRSTSSSSVPSIKGELLCRLWYSRVVYFTGFAISTFNLTVISMERYLAVVHPLFYLASFKRHSTHMITAFAWLTAPLMQVVLAAALYRFQDGECVYIGRGPGIGIGVFVWEFLLPVSVMTYAFVTIALKLRSIGRVSAVWARNGRSVRVNTVVQGALSVAEQPVPSRAETLNEDPTKITEKATKSPQAPGNIRRRKTTVTLLIIYLTYMVCWTPNQCAFLVFNFGAIPEYFGGRWHAMTTVLATFNICVNPIVYAFRYNQFRQGFRQILNKYICCFQ